MRSIIAGCLLIGASFLLYATVTPTWTINFGSQIRYNDGCVGVACASPPVGGMSVTHADHGDHPSSTWLANGDALLITDDSFGVNYAYATGGCNTCVKRVTGSTIETMALTNINQLTGYGGISAVDFGGWTDGMTAKGLDIFTVSGVTYLSIGRSDFAQCPSITVQPCYIYSVINPSIVKSSDDGITWTNAAAVTNSTGAAPAGGVKMFSEGGSERSPSMGGMMFVRYGMKDGACPDSDPDGCQTYIYAVSTNGCYAGCKDMFTGRVLRSAIANLSASDWTFRHADGSWGALASAGAIFSDATSRRLSMTQLTWIPVLHKYVGIVFYWVDAVAGTGLGTTHTRWNFLVCDHPWGGCSIDASQQINITGDAYFAPNFIEKFGTSGLSSLTVFYAGDYARYNESPNSTPYGLHANTIMLGGITKGLFPAPGGFGTAR